MIIQDGWLDKAHRTLSPNFDDRPPETEINLLVIHNISLPPGEFGGPWIDALFTNTLDADAHPFFCEICNLKVSSHLLIRRSGEIIQYVSFDNRAWHAGESEFRGITRCNDYSIGIELEGTDELPYEEIQYQKLAVVTRAIMKNYPAITIDRITGHNDIAPTRKTDPGPAFDWVRYHSMVSDSKIA